MIVFDKRLRLVGGEQWIDLLGPGLQSADDVFDEDWPIGWQEGPHPLDGQLWVIATTANDVHCQGATRKPKQNTSDGPQWQQQPPQPTHENKEKKEPQDKKKMTKERGYTHH